MPKSGQALLENARVQAFLATVRSQCRKCNVQFVLADAHEVGGRGKNSLWGFFQEPTVRTGNHRNQQSAGMLKIATRDIPVSDWIVTLAHEYAHFLQWFRDDPIYESDSYLELEIATEAEAFQILKRFGIPINYEAAKRKSKKYIAKVRKEEKEESQ
jgi:hypothetical protein